MNKKNKPAKFMKLGWRVIEVLKDDLEVGYLSEHKVK
jgi:hypothetical protein